MSSVTNELKWKQLQKTTVGSINCILFEFFEKISCRLLVCKAFFYHLIYRTPNKTWPITHLVGFYLSVLCLFLLVIKNIIGIYCRGTPFGMFIWTPNRSLFTLISNISGVFRYLIAEINFVGFERCGRKYLGIFLILLKFYSYFSYERDIKLFYLIINNSN